MYACKFRMNGEDGRLHLKKENAEELRNQIDLHCCQSGAVPVPTSYWCLNNELKRESLYCENIRYEQTVDPNQVVLRAVPTHPRSIPSFPIFSVSPSPSFFLVSISYGFSLIPQDLDLSNIFLIYPVSRKNEINTFILALVTVLLLKGRYTVILKKWKNIFC